MLYILLYTFWWNPRKAPHGSHGTIGAKRGRSTTYPQARPVRGFDPVFQWGYHVTSNQSWRFSTWVLGHLRSWVASFVVHFSPLPWSFSLGPLFLLKKRLFSSGTEDGTPNRSTPGLSPMRCVTFANLGIQKGCPVSSLRMIWHGPIKYTHASKTIQNINVNIFFHNISHQAGSVPESNCYVDSSQQSFKSAPRPQLDPLAAEYFFLMEEWCPNAASEKFVSSLRKGLAADVKNGRIF